MVQIRDSLCKRCDPCPFADMQMYLAVVSALVVAAGTVQAVAECMCE